jgi:hypothetical protein
MSEVCCKCVLFSVSRQPFGCRHCWLVLIKLSVLLANCIIHLCYDVNLKRIVFIKVHFTGFHNKPPPILCQRATSSEIIEKLRQQALQDCHKKNRNDALPKSEETLSVAKHFLHDVEG